MTKRICIFEEHDDNCGCVRCLPGVLHQKLVTLDSVVPAMRADDARNELLLVCSQLLRAISLTFDGLESRRLRSLADSIDRGIERHADEIRLTA